MECKHEELECTNNVFRCLRCGREVLAPVRTDEKSPEEEKPKKTPRKPSKKGEN